MNWKKLCSAVLLLALLASVAGCEGLLTPSQGPVEDIPGLPGGAVPGASVPQDEEPDTPLPADPALGEAVAGALPQTGGTPLTEADGVTLREVTVLYPEGATEANAVYSLRFALPVFGAGFPGAEAINAELARYEEELLGRVAEERLPLADGEGDALPSTTVACGAQRVGDYVNVFLTETVSFAGETETETVTSALAFDAAGSRLSLASYTGVYEPEALAAQQVFNVIDANRADYFGDLAMEDIMAALDLYGGFYATLEGCGLMISPGVLAPEERGPLHFLIPRAAFYPACVGDVLSLAEYEALRPALDHLVAACAIDYSEFTASSPNAYTASAFLTRLLTTGTEGEYYVAVDKAQYEGFYSDYFTGPLPDGLYTAGDGVYEDGASAMVPVYPHAAYSLRIDDAVRDNGSLILYGMIQYGVPGTADAGELTGVTVTLAPSASAPLGYVFNSLVMGL